MTEDLTGARRECWCVPLQALTPCCSDSRLRSISYCTVKHATVRPGKPCVLTLLDLLLASRHMLARRHVARSLWPAPWQRARLLCEMGARSLRGQAWRQPGIALLTVNHAAAGAMLWLFVSPSEQPSPLPCRPCLPSTIAPATTSAVRCRASRARSREWDHLGCAGPGWAGHASC